METNLPLDSEIHTIEITPESRSYLLETAKWGRFLAIVGFVFVGLFALMFLFMGGTLFSSGLGDEFGGAESAALSGFLIGYMIFIFAITLFPLYYLFTFSTRTIRAIKSTNTEDLTDGLKNLKSLFKFYGIFTAIIIGFYAIAFVGVLIFGGMSAF